MSDFFDALDTFFGQLAAVGWTALGVALGCHLLRLLTRVAAWRNILVAAHPGARVPWRTVFGAYAAGVGVNSIVPARGGDLLKVYLVKRRIAGGSYATVGATLVVETLFDSAVGVALLAWALTLGVFPGLDVLPDLPQIDWGWPVEHPREAAIAAGILLAALLVLGILGWRRVVAFKQRVAQGFAILRDLRRYLRQVATWQAASWVLRLLAIYWFLRAFHIPATAYHALLVQVVQSLSTVIPLTPGGAGTQQGLLVYVLRGEASTSELLSFSVGMYVALTVFNAVLGFAAIVVMLRTLRWRRVVGPDAKTAEP